MPQQAALRLARSLFEEHCHEERFDVELMGEDVESVADAFRLLGCRVEKHRFKDRLTVLCPDENHRN